MQVEWAGRGSFILTFLEPAVSALHVHVLGRACRRSRRMLAYWHGQIWNVAAFGRSFGLAVRNGTPLSRSAERPSGHTSARAESWQARQAVG